MRAEQVIATHSNTDFDAFASMLAARRLYPGAVVCIGGSLNRNVREFYRLHADDLEIVEAARLELDAVRRLIVVETVHAGRLGELERVARDPAVEKIVFDHHAGELPDWVSATNAVISTDGALATTMAGILAEREIAVTPLEATALALGIHEDTGSLTYPSATQRDAEALGWCLRHGALQDLLAAFLRTPLAPDELELLGELMEKATTHRVGGIEVLLAAISWPRYIEGVSNLAHKLVDLTDCQALVLLVEMDDRVFCVTRSRIADLDAGAAARSLGGGGHAQAASAIFRGSLDEARSLVLDGLPQAIRQPLRARDVMSKPVRSVEPDETVARAMAVCQRHGQSGLLVTHDGRLVGVVTRSDVLRALGASAVEGTEEAESVATQLAELQHLAPVFEAVSSVAED